MVDFQKETQTALQLLARLEDAIKSRNSLSEAEIQITPLAENERGENFKIVIQNESELGQYQIEELHTVFAPILGKFSLAGSPVT